MYRQNSTTKFPNDYFQQFVDSLTLPNTNTTDAESFRISVSLLRPVVSSHVMSWLSMTFTARQPSVSEHCLIHPNFDGVLIVIKTLLSRFMW